MLDELVCLRNVVQWEPFGDVKALPARLKRLIDVASGFDPCLSGYIVTANEEDPGVDEDELPEWDFWRRSIGGVRRDRTALRQYLYVELDVSGESHFDDVMNAAGSCSLDSFRELFIGQEDLICART